VRFADIIGAIERGLDPLPVAGAFVAFAASLWALRLVLASRRDDAAAPGDTRPPVMPMAAGPSNEALIETSRASPDGAAREAARAELDRRRTANRQAGLDNGHDGLDFLVGYVTGFPVPSAAGLVGAMLHPRPHPEPAMAAAPGIVRDRSRDDTGDAPKPEATDDRQDAPAEPPRSDPPSPDPGGGADAGGGSSE